MMPLLLFSADDECARMRSEYIACVMTPYLPCHTIVDKYLECTTQQKRQQKTSGGD